MAPPTLDQEADALDRAVETPHQTIEPPGWISLDLPEIWRFRDLLTILAMRDLKVRYKQTVLGVSWVILQPLIGAGILSFVFGGVAKLEAPGGVPYFLFSFTGMLLWHAFSTTLNRSGSALVGNSHIVAKVYFPRLILPMSTVFSALIDFAVGAVLYTILLAMLWHFPGWEILMAPVCLLVAMLLAVGVGFALSALAVPYRDINYLRPVTVQFLLYASPVAYAVSAVPEAQRGIYLLNPLAPLLQTFRWAALGVGQPSWGYFALAAAVSLVVFLIGAIIFSRMERSFADVI